MALDIDGEVAALARLTVSELQAKYCDVFGEQPRGRHRQWLIRRIVWRKQALAEGGLSARAQGRAKQLANEADLRLTPPAGQGVATDRRWTAASVPHARPDQRLPMPGGLVTRNYKGRTLVVKVMQNGFEFDGEVFTSLSAVAKKVTGSHWNGFHFFGLIGREAAHD
jgi:Protein of unknown function (DUF2924)